jgi:hypothetical protein
MGGGHFVERMFCGEDLLWQGTFCGKDVLQAGHFVAGCFVKGCSVGRTFCRQGRFVKVPN